MSMAAFFDRWQNDMAAMKEQAPGIAKSFGTLFSSLMADGALSVREKELIALGIGLATRCENCIYLHVEKCLNAGASSAQVLEAAGVAVMMQGGPTFTYVPEVIRALQHLDSKKPGRGGKRDFDI